MSHTLSSMSNNSNVSKPDQMKQVLGTFMIKNISKEAKNINPEHVKLLSNFNIPLHKYNKY